MSDFNPVSLFHIALETLGLWFWAMALITAVLLIGVWTGFRRLRKQGRSASKPALIAVIAGLCGTAVCAAVLPSLTHASMSDLSGFVDYILVLLLSLLMGLGIFAAVFSVTARR